MMEKKLIVDSGSTKTAWVFIEQGEKKLEFLTEGFNPYYLEKEGLQKLFAAILPDSLRKKAPGEIHFYGTGCSTLENCQTMRGLFSATFPQADIHVHHDLYGAALALFQESTGIACILGTGSNSCLWNGMEIVKSVPSLGYLLGDEGSGTYLGKLLLKEILSDKTDRQIQKLFYQYTGLDFGSILHKIYTESNANRWIASLSKFAGAHRDHPAIRKIIRKNFQDFIKEQIVRYDEYESLPVAFTGSVAYHFQTILQEELKQHNIHFSHVIKEPISGLVAYHSKIVTH